MKGIRECDQVKIIRPSSRDELPTQMPSSTEVDACIVATISEQHFLYLNWSLRTGLHTLSDKPLTFHANASTDPAQARKIASDYGELKDLAEQTDGLIFMLATQKRYQWAFHKMAERLERVAETGYPVTCVDCMTSDGYWMLPWEYSGQRYHSYDYGGGKLTHTGYHFLDIVPWLMRHSDISGDKMITHAFVTANLFRPSDSVAMMSAEKIGTLMHFGAGHAAEVADDLGDINSYVQVKFCNGKRLITSVNFTFLHEGFSLRTTTDPRGAVTGRTKIDHMTISQGPVFYARFGRVAKMLDAEAVSPIGRPDHFELDFIANNITGLPRIERLKPESLETYEGCGDDELPTADFFEAILNPSRVPLTVSPTSDHQIGVQLLSAAYESAARSYKHKQQDGTPVPVKIDFDPLLWQKPPRYWT
jgi:predicted dehydrogenase